MGSQSSVSVVLRALVMLGFLVAIPLVAMFGSSLPSLLNPLLEGRWPSALLGETGEGDRPASASQFEPMGAQGAAPGNAPAPPWREDPLRQVPAWPTGSFEANPSAITPASFETPVAALAGGDGSQGSPVQPRAGEPAPLPASVGGASPMDAASTRAVPIPGREGSSSDEDFVRYQQKLRDLGAAYYLLEGWGNQQNLYRFFCKMSVGGSLGCTRHFEATHADPLKAMAEVVAQVEAWRDRGLEN